MLRSAWMLLPLTAALSLSAEAENWPEFRGPTGQGLSTAKGLPTEWSATENVQWTADVPGTGWSSPIVHDGRIYLTAAVPLDSGKPNGDQSLRALCLDGASGKILWNEEVFQQAAETIPGHFHSKNSHASPTPATDGRHLFVHFGNQGTACLTLDGKTVWKTRKLQYDPRHGGGPSPVLVDGLVVVVCDGLDVQFIAALDQKTGEVRWKKDRPDSGDSSPFSFSTPLVIEAEGQKQIVSPASDKVVAYAPQDGREIWWVEYVGYSVVPRPVYANGLVYLSTSFNNPVVYAIRPTGQGNVTDTHVAWTLRRGGPKTPSLLAVGNELYAVSDDGIATCLDGRTGKVHWKERLDGNYSASPLFADGKVYFQSEDGLTTVIAAGTEFRPLARNDIGGRTLASPAVIDSDLLIRTADRLYRIGKD